MDSRDHLTIVQMNDTHAYLDLHPERFWEGGRVAYRPAGGFARIATLVKQIRRECGGRVLFCDGGDTLHGTYPAVASQGQALLPIVNTLGIAAMTAHWEFAYGPAMLRRRVTELAYPLLACNVYDQQTDQLFFSPTTVVEVFGLRVGIIGIASNIVATTMPPAFSAGLRFTLGREELPDQIEQLRTRERVDLIVLLSHLGFPQDLKLVGEVAGVDVCLSSHTHNRLARPARVGRTLVIQSGCHGSFLGRLDLVVERGRVIDYQHQLIEVDISTQPDPEIEDLVRQATAPYAAELAEVVGETATPLDRGTALEATMDNLLLQALQEHTGAQLAFSNGWRFGAPVVPGPVTMNDLYNIIPMNPPVSSVELTGLEVTQMLEENLERTYAPDPYGQMGGYLKRCLGLRLAVKLENPAGHRIQHLAINDEVVRPDRRYQAVFVTEQGVPRQYGHNRQEQAERAIDVLRAYLTRHRPAHAAPRGTVVVV